MSIEALPRISSESRRHRVVEALREAVITGRLRPGDRLVESDISRQMGISRGPVREALQQLEHEGLVISFPYRGTEVLGVSQAEVEEVLVPIRLFLERFAFCQALQALTQDDFDELESVVRSMRDAAETDNLNKLVEADVRFHELVIDKSGQQHCAQIWRTILPRVRAYFYRDGPRHGSLAEITEEHQELLEALKTKDMDRVSPVLDEHILATLHLEGSPKDNSRKARGLDGENDVGQLVYKTLDGQT